MAAFNGVVNTGIFVDNVLRCSQTIQDQDMGAPTLKTPIDGMVTAPLASGPHTMVVAGMNATVEIGRKVDSFLDDYYYRIHLNPTQFTLGAVLAAVEETFLIWNAWFVSKTCSAINETNGSEFDLTGLTAPFALQGLGYTEYTLTVPEEGATEFTATATFVFPNESRVLTITGTRMILFVWEPRDNIKESIEWLTNILKAKDGTEQRVSIRDIGRQGFQIEVFFHNEQDQIKFETSLFTWQKLRWGLPIWTEWAAHSGTISIDDTTISDIVTAGADFRTAGLAVVYKSPTEYEVVKIDTVNANGLILDTPIKQGFTGDKLIMPVRLAYMDNAIKNRVTPDGQSSAQCSFVCTDNILLTSFTPGTTYKTFTVLTQATYLKSGGVDYQSDADWRVLDPGTGKFRYYSDSEFNIITQTHVLKAFTKAEAWNNREFIHSLIGRLTTVWIPTFKQDLIQVATIGAADVNFNIQNVGLADYMMLNTLRTHLAFVFPDNTQIHREITGITESGNEEVISIDSSLGQEVEVGDCEISFLDKYRLAKDGVELDWENVGRHECSLLFQRIKA